MKKPIGSILAALVLGTTVQAYTPGEFYFQGRPSEKLIALTFDDGPGGTTERILEFLKEQNIQATFFMSGTSIEAFPEIAKKVVEAGHEVGNHTYRHLNYRKLGDEAQETFRHELAQTEASLQRATGQTTEVVRMPHGYFNKTWLLPTLKEHHYALVHWSYGCDWKIQQSGEEMAKGYMAHAGRGAVFLFHDGGRKFRPKTFHALTTSVKMLQEQGYRFISAKEMFAP